MHARAMTMSSRHTPQNATQARREARSLHVGCQNQGPDRQSNSSNIDRGALTGYPVATRSDALANSFFILGLSFSVISRGRMKGFVRLRHTAVMRHINCRFEYKISQKSSFKTSQRCLTAGGLIQNATSVPLANRGRIFL